MIVPEDDVPTYAYACTACDHRFEIQQAFTDSSLTECPRCSGRLRKVFNAVGIVFKGSGFYRTDSRSSGTSKSSTVGASPSTSEASQNSASTNSQSTDSTGASASDSTGSSSTSTGPSSSATSGVPAPAGTSAA